MKKKTLKAMKSPEFTKLKNLVIHGKGLSEIEENQLMQILSKVSPKDLQALYSLNKPSLTSQMKVHNGEAYFLIKDLEKDYAAFTVRMPKQTRKSNGGFFRFVELFSFFLPAKVRLSTFEPAYNDAKLDYLRVRGRHKSKLARSWLRLCFGLHIGLMVIQCLWGMCSERVKKLFILSLPDVFRKFLGN